MKKLKINYVPKTKIYPAFGEAWEKTQTINIRKDLPKAVQKFLIEHEKFHLKDWAHLNKNKKEYNWIIGELKAGFYGAIKHPFGFLICFLMSLSPSRLKFYWKRFKEGK